MIVIVIMYFMQFIVSNTKIHIFFYVLYHNVCACIWTTVVFINSILHSAPLMRDCLDVAVGLIGSKDPANPAFKDRETTKSPRFWPPEPSLRGAIISEDLSRTYVCRAFW